MLLIKLCNKTHFNRNFRTRLFILLPIPLLHTTQPLRRCSAAKVSLLLKAERQKVKVLWSVPCYFEYMQYSASWDVKNWINYILGRTWIEWHSSSMKQGCQVFNTSLHGFSKALHLAHKRDTPIEPTGYEVCSFLICFTLNLLSFHALLCSATYSLWTWAAKPTTS